MPVLMKGGRSTEQRANAAYSGWRGRLKGKTSPAEIAGCFLTFKARRGIITFGVIRDFHHGITRLNNDILRMIWLVLW